LEGGRLGRAQTGFWLYRTKRGAGGRQGGGGGAIFTKQKKGLFCTLSGNVLGGGGAPAGPNIFFRGEPRGLGGGELRPPKGGERGGAGGQGC